MMIPRYEVKAIAMLFKFSCIVQLKETCHESSLDPIDGELAQSLSVCQVCGLEELGRWLEARSVRSSQMEVKEAGLGYPDGGEGSSEYESSNSDANGG